MGLIRSISKLFGHHRGNSRPSIPEGYEAAHVGPLAIGPMLVRPKQIYGGAGISYQSFPQVSMPQIAHAAGNFQSPESQAEVSSHTPFSAGLREIQGMRVGPNLSEQYSASPWNSNSQQYETPVQMLLEGGQRSESNNPIQRRRVTVQPYDYFNQGNWQ